MARKTTAKLSRKAIESLIGEMESSAVCGRMDLWNLWADSKGDAPAIVEFPLGELTNSRIAGYLWAWNLQGKIQIIDIESTDNFNAQGLEGKVRVNVSLTTALSVYRELPAYRCQVYSPTTDGGR